MEQTDVGLDQRDAEWLCFTQPVEAVPRAMRHDERRHGPAGGPLGPRPHRQEGSCILASLEENREGEPDEHDPHAGRDVDHEVVGRDDHREAHGDRERERDGTSARPATAITTTTATRRFQPACRLGKAA